MRRNRLTFEVCIDTPAGLNACAGLVDRIELCSALDLGGLTPDPGLIALAAQSGLPGHVMIRPRAGDFCYDAAETTAMCASIAAVKEAGLTGVVIGARKGDALDLKTLTTLIRAAKGLEVTLHRVIDLLPDPIAAMEQAITLGIDRILTSGGAPKAVDGLAQIARLYSTANGRIEIMAGSGVSVSNLAEIADMTGVTSFHSSCAKDMPVAADLQQFGFAKTQRVTDRATVQAFRAALDHLAQT
ncbi:copper homeostasis protein CutC [Shimia sp. MMG029]|uniref:copper homeostasis protein CutC n=1 Tax=Shimia sp. MMG029 TaxID=3021978 RepID=UPI0022FEE619|nr:copper homeostasis protein CutC [Shimia sp. MMG029]MDA5556929.1 copper homeostasis protein CutC [Shimia sp. MMG029]